MHENVSVALQNTKANLLRLTSMSLKSLYWCFAVIQNYHFLLIQLAVSSGCLNLTVLTKLSDSKLIHLTAKHFIWEARLDFTSANISLCPMHCIQITLFISVFMQANTNIFFLFFPPTNGSMFCSVSCFFPCNTVSWRFPHISVLIYRLYYIIIYII